MNNTIELILRSVLIGTGATMTMDVWAAGLRRLGIPSLNFAFLGRWLGPLPSGRWFHENISRTAPVARELVLGWCAHYAIGIGFAALLLTSFGLEWARTPTLFPALVIGLVTVVAPLFILQPALGAGIASSKTPTPLLNSAKSVATHVVFGIGLFAAARVTASLFPVGE
jgi:hypothetical protein